MYIKENLTFLSLLSHHFFSIQQFNYQNNQILILEDFKHACVLNKYIMKAEVHINTELSLGAKRFVNLAKEFLLSKNSEIMILK